MRIENRTEVATFALSCRYVLSAAVIIHMDVQSILFVGTKSINVATDEHRCGRMIVGPAVGSLPHNLSNVVMLALLTSKWQSSSASHCQNLPCLFI
jgi:hypothetical protein